MKTFTRSILSVLTISLLVSCSDGERQDTPTPSTAEGTPTPSPAETQAQVETSTPSPAPSPTAEPTPTLPPDTDADLDGWSLGEGDCADDDKTVNPDKREVCDGKDNNCNGFVDDGNVQKWLLQDRDGDGAGGDDDGLGYLPDGISPQDIPGAVLACDGLEGYSDPIVNGFDCNDFDTAISPTALDDTADGIDQNCNEVDGL